MGRSVIIDTPFLSVEEVARKVGVSKARLKVLRQIVDGTYVERPRASVKTPKRKRAVSKAQAKNAESVATLK
jgi:hypothetical protein